MNKYNHELAQLSLTGDRKRNQDRCTVVEGDNTLLLAVADGMGGHPKGEVAAQLLMETCRKFLNKSPQPILNPGSFLKHLMHKAHEEIVSFGYQQEPVIEPRTTAVTALIQNGTAYWAHAGDSRLYLFRNKKLLARTTDHSYVERLLQLGMINKKQLKHHPQKNYVTRCLGGSMTLPEITLDQHQIQPGDVIALCSDGVWGNIDDTTMIRHLFSDLPLEQAVETLTQEATLKAFPEADNATLLALRLGGSPGSGKEAASPKKTYDLGDAIANLQDAISNIKNEIMQEKK